jgi:TRAP-type C4-dicarboxylate transport system substrate-binding protein
LLGKTTLHGRALDAFRQALAQRTGERLVLNVRWAGAAGFRGSERALVSGLRTEQFDGAALGSKALPLVHPSVAATNLPGVVDSWTKVDALRDELRDQFGAEFEHEGLRRLAWLDEGCERVMTRGQPVRRASDLAHRRVAMSDTDPFAPILYSLVPGSVPVALESSGIGDALRDGSRLGVSVVVATAGDAERFQWTHQLDHVTLMPLSCASGALVLRKAVHERLDAELRAVVDDLSARLENESGPLARHADTAASLRLGRSLAHVDLTPAERRDWRRLFVDAAHHSTPALLPGGLVDKAILLGHEIDALD